MTRLLWLPDKLRAWGLDVVEDRGWERRGDPFPRTPEVVVCHHTATSLRAKGDLPTLGILRDGRHDLPGPLCQLGLGRSGKVWVIASGVGNHAGHGEWDGVNVGNSRSIGIEAEHDGRSPWEPKQQAAYDVLCAALLDGINQPASRLAAHKETALPRGRKTDPTLDMDDMRRRVHALLARPYKTAKTGDDDMTPEQDARLKRVEEFLDALTAPRRQDKADRDGARLDLGDLLNRIERLEQQVKP